MELFCPACQAEFTGINRCPRCGGRVFRPDEVTADGRPRPRPRRTPVAPVAVGLGVAVGVYLGLAELAAAVGVTEGWVTAGLRGFAVLAGGVLSGAGRRDGFGVGAVVGGGGGGLLLAADLLTTADPPSYPLAAALGLVGGVAGVVGAWVWPAPPVLDLPTPEPRRSSSIRLPAEPKTTADGPSVAWVRVLVGAAVIAAGVLLADAARVEAQAATRGALRVESRDAGQLLSASLAVLVGLAGGAVAAAGTGAWPRQGAMAGGLGAAGVVGGVLFRPTPPVPVVYLLDRLGLAAADPAGLAAAAVGTAAVGLIGGWFGGALFPPLAPRPLWRRPGGGG